jgi:hypothetical protein
MPRTQNHRALTTGFNLEMRPSVPSVSSKSVVEDSGFPFRLESSLRVMVLIDREAGNLLIMPLEAERQHSRKRR